MSFSSSDVTLTLTNLATTQAGRNLRLNLTGTSGGARNLILGSDMQINKLYLVNNTLSDAVTVKNTTGTGIAVPAGKTMFVFNNGTNVVDAVTHLSSLTLGSALPVASGGTGITAFGTGVATALGVNTGSAGAFVVNGGALGTPSSGTLTNATGLPISTGVSGLGTNVATALAVNVGSSGAFVANGGVLGTPSSGTLSSCTVDGTNSVGFRDVPAVGTKTTSYTLQTADVGKYVQIGSGGSIEIPDSTFSEGDVVSLFNNTTGDITVTCTITTAYIAGTDEDKATVTLATRGVATILFISGTVCVIGGNVS